MEGLIELVVRYRVTCLAYDCSEILELTACDREDAARQARNKGWRQHAVVTTWHCPRCVERLHLAKSV